MKAKHIIKTIAMLIMLCPSNLLAQQYKVNRVGGDVTVKEGRHFIEVQPKQNIQSNQQLRLTENSFVELICRENNRCVYKEGPVQGTITELTKEKSGIEELPGEFIVYLYKKLFSNTPVKVKDVAAVYRGDKNAETETANAFYVYNTYKAKLTTRKGKEDFLQKYQELYEDDVIELEEGAGIEILDFNNGHIVTLLNKPGKYHMGNLFSDNKIKKTKIKDLDKFLNELIMK